MGSQKQKDLSKFKNSSLKSSLLNPKLIPRIEDILALESEKFQVLQEMKSDGALTFGDEVSRKDLKDIFPNVCKEVDDFLGIEDHSLPRFGYFDFFRPGLPEGLILGSYIVSATMVIDSLIKTYYSFSNGAPLSDLGDLFIGTFNLSIVGLSHLNLKTSSTYLPYIKRVTLKKQTLPYTIASSAHEYSHYLQEKAGINSKKYLAFKEGHAIGIEKQTSMRFYEKEDDPAFLYKSTDRTVGELRSTYLWACKNLGLDPKKSLCEVESSRDETEEYHRRTGKNPTIHSLGNTFFSIHEMFKGEEIYKQVLDGEFDFSL